MDFAERRTWGPKPNYPKVRSYEPPADQKFIVIAGPCSVESEDQIFKIAEFVKAHGATHLRGGVFRAGTYPGSSFGLVDESLLKAYRVAAMKYDLINIIEVLDYSDHALLKVLKYCDAVQIGARQMQNYTLLRKLGSFGRQVFLKRHPGATLDEWLGAAEHLLHGGDCHPVLIERGSSTNANHVRWDLSLSMIPAIKALSKIPVVSDASHGTGRRDLVEPMTLAGVAAGASGILVETHYTPDKSLSDADQAIGFEEFAALMKKVKKIKEALGQRV